MDESSAIDETYTADIKSTVDKDQLANTSRPLYTNTTNQ